MCCEKFVKGEVCLSEDTYTHKLYLKKIEVCKIEAIKNSLFRRNKTKI